MISRVTWKVSDCGFYTSRSCLKYLHIISMLCFGNLSFVLSGRYCSLILQHCVWVPSLCPDWSILWDLEERTPFRWTFALCRYYRAGVSDPGNSGSTECSSWLHCGEDSRNASECGQDRACQHSTASDHC